MKPFYFRESDNSLFGIYHPPTSAGWRDRGVVLCYPYSNEYIRSHPAYVLLTTMLNKSGFPVLRFDYYATGDSLGEDEEMSIERWRQDIKCAIKELKNIAGVPRVTLVGLRLGASLIATLDDVTTDLSSIVLWDPIIYGKKYLDGLNKIHQKIFHDEINIENRSELLGYPLTEQFKQSILDIDLTKIDHVSSRKIFCVLSYNSQEYNNFRHHLEDMKININFEQVDYNWSWGEAEGPMYIPVNILQSITINISKESM